MPDAINHLSAFNRIATALENLPEDDLTAIVSAINAIANKTIPVADMTGIGTKLDTLNTTLAGLSLGGGSSGVGGSLDCSCLADVLAPLIEKIDQMICVNVAIANSQHQIEKSIAYWTQDGPQFGIDAPPGSFIFPVPTDSTPPQISTPWPGAADTPTNSSGSWTAPPVVNGTYYVAPPGGMNGSTDITIYRNYKCDVAAFIYNYIVSWFDTVLSGYDWVGLGYMGVEGLSVITTILSQALAFGAPGGTVVGTLLGIEFVKSGVTAGALLMSLPEFLLVSTLLATTGAVNYVAGGQFEDYRELVVAQKEKVICALYKANSPSAARDNVMIELNKYVTNMIDIGQGSFIQGAFIRRILSDNLLAMLFACQENFDTSTIDGLGAANGGCVYCILCEDMDVILNVGLESDADYQALADIGQAGGLVPYPIAYPITFTTGVLAICATMTSQNEVTGGGSNVPTAGLAIYKDNVFIKNATIGVGVGVTQEILLSCPQAGYFDPTPVPFLGNYVITLSCQGTASSKPRFRFETLSYKEVEPA